MNDTVYIKYLEGYQQHTNENWGAIAKRLGVTPATISNWRRGGKISLVNRNGIATLTGMPNSSEARNNIIIGVGNAYGNTLGNTTGDSLEKFRAGLIETIIQLDIDPAAKDAVLKAVTAFKREG